MSFRKTSADSAALICVRNKQLRAFVSLCLTDAVIASDMWFSLWQHSYSLKNNTLDTGSLGCTFYEHERHYKLCSQWYTGDGSLMVWEVHLCIRLKSYKQCWLCDEIAFSLVPMSKTMKMENNARYTHFLWVKSPPLLPGSVWIFSLSWTALYSSLKLWIFQYLSLKRRQYIVISHFTSLGPNSNAHLPSVWCVTEVFIGFYKLLCVVQVSLLICRPAPDLTNKLNYCLSHVSGHCTGFVSSVGSFFLPSFLPPPLSSLTIVSKFLPLWVKAYFSLVLTVKVGGGRPCNSHFVCVDQEDLSL